jgi:hypothetical protein
MEDDADDLMDDGMFDLVFGGHDSDLDILDDAYYNIYLIATKKKTLEELLIESVSDGMILFLPYDPSDPETLNMVIPDAIKYFEDTEEYEYCAELTKALNTDT